MAPLSGLLAERFRPNRAFFFIPFYLRTLGR